MRNEENIENIVVREKYAMNNLSLRFKMSIIC